MMVKLMQAYSRLKDVGSDEWQENGAAAVINAHLQEDQAQTILDFLTPGQGDLGWFYLEAMVGERNGNDVKEGFRSLLKERLMNEKRAA